MNIVFNARKYGAILVTHDGASKRQPGGILGSREPLHALGVSVMTAHEAVDYIRRRIAERDKRARRLASERGVKAPNWVGED